MYSQNSNFPVDSFRQNMSYSQSMPYSYQNYSDDRLIGGGFAFPFLLGGVTGAALAPAFWRPNYPNYYYPPFRPPFRPPFYGPNFRPPFRPY